METEIKVFVVVLVPFYRSRVPEVLGVYNNREKAEDRIYREGGKLGYNHPMFIIESVLDIDEENP